MSDSDNSRRGKFDRREAAKFLSKHYNRIARQRVRNELRKGCEPAPEQHRHGALWDAY